MTLTVGSLVTLWIGRFLLFCLLSPLKAAFPRSTMTWITRPDSVPLLRDNPFIDEISLYGPEALLQLVVLLPPRMRLAQKRSWRPNYTCAVNPP